MLMTVESQGEGDDLRYNKGDKGKTKTNARPDIPPTIEEDGSV
jgi:hypothetical protein